MVDNFFISIVIPTLNGGSIMKDCVHKIVDQVCEFKFELIVIDSGSIDNSLDYINGYCTKNFIEVKIVSINKKTFHMVIPEIKQYLNLQVISLYFLHRMQFLSINFGY